METKELIKIENVKKTYLLGKVRLDILKGVSLDIKEGDFVVILGPSGSGKSTLLNIIGLLDFPSEGKTFFKGKDVSKMSEDSLAQLRGKRIGFIFQQFNLLSHLTALENVTLPMLFQGLPEIERKSRAKLLLESVGLGNRIDHRPFELSGGEQQRVAIARALANNPDIIVADEPTGNLDSKTGKNIMEILISLHKRDNKTIIVVTHDSNIAQYCHKIVNIKDGEIVTNHLAEKDIVWQKKK